MDSECTQQLQQIICVALLGVFELCRVLLAGLDVVNRTWTGYEQQPIVGAV